MAGCIQGFKGIIKDKEREARFGLVIWYRNKVSDNFDL